ncbi:hypothetical protein NC653_012630 [Populus alba x Populus x berolinensis]|uniref:Uncharacterized protein n=1 Tax=Populus alba x Populus x berolinensis TaxID=444605 RepID=A0AAD6QSU0_9ROSI|nr:hypothetical protein NC653_012630 [Populus alba x Populus x berolinensis]
MSELSGFAEPRKILCLSVLIPSLSNYQYITETEIQEAMLRPERRVPTKSTVSSQDTLFPENHASALHKVIHESVEEEPEWLGHCHVGSIKEGVN